MPTTQSGEQYQELGAARAADARRAGDRTTPPSSETARRPIPGRVMPDLSNNCPVCGIPYVSGERVAALVSVPFASSDVAPLPAPPGDGTDTIALGHQGCVLPRLLTLLAGFQPESRFETAATEYFTRAYLGRNPGYPPGAGAVDQGRPHPGAQPDATARIGGVGANAKGQA